jgi:hypothetical protein
VAKEEDSQAQAQKAIEDHSLAEAEEVNRTTAQLSDKTLRVP